MSVAPIQDSVLLTLDISPLKMTDQQFYEFCRRNQDFRFEIDGTGSLIVTSPGGLETSRATAKSIFSSGYGQRKVRSVWLLNVGECSPYRTAPSRHPMLFGF